MRYDLRKFSFSNRVRTLWNSLPDVAVKAESSQYRLIHTVLRKDWTDSGMIRNLNSIGKLTLKVPEAGVI